MMGMQGRQVGLGTLCAVLLWMGTFACVLTGTVAALGADGSDGFGVAIAFAAHGLALSAAAATVTICNAIGDQTRKNREAFLMGRDIAGESARRGFGGG